MPERDHHSAGGGPVGEARSLRLPTPPPLGQSATLQPNRRLWSGTVPQGGRDLAHKPSHRAHGKQAQRRMIGTQHNTRRRPRGRRGGAKCGATNETQEAAGSPPPPEIAGPARRGLTPGPGARPPRRDVRARRDHSRGIHPPPLRVAAPPMCSFHGGMGSGTSREQAERALDWSIAAIRKLHTMYLRGCRRRPAAGMTARPCAHSDWASRVRWGGQGGPGSGARWAPLYAGQPACHRGRGQGPLRSAGPAGRGAACRSRERGGRRGGVPPGVVRGGVRAKINVRC